MLSRKDDAIEIGGGTAGNIRDLPKVRVRSTGGRELGEARSATAVEDVHAAVLDRLMIRAVANVHDREAVRLADLLLHGQRPFLIGWIVNVLLRGGDVGS